jgi:hypothetical protein
MEKMRVRYVGEEYVYIHNTLWSVAHHLKDQIEAKLKDGRDGIGLDSIACLTMLAFTLEAALNFLGLKIFGESWKERTPTIDKFHVLLEKLSIPTESVKELADTIRALVKFRNTVAHGKPEIIPFEHEEVIPAHSTPRRPFVVADWESYCRPENVLEIYPQIDRIWKLLLEKADIHPIDTLSGGESTTTRLGKV